MERKRDLFEWKCILGSDMIVNYVFPSTETSTPAVETSKPPQPSSVETTTTQKPSPG